MMSDNEAGTPTDGATSGMDAGSGAGSGAGMDTGFVPPVPPPAGPAIPAGEPPQPPPFSRPASSVGAPRPRRRIWGPVLAGVAIGAVLGGGAGAGVGFVLQQNSGGAGMPVSGPQTITVNDYDHTTLVSAVAAAAMPSVVTVSVAGSNGSGTGSGVVIDDDGHILTNNHVVTLGGMEASPTIRVTTSSGRVFPAEVVGTDPLMDLAVLRVDGAEELVPVEFADSRDLNVGDTTIAIGAPLGLSGTVTSGIVSSLDRSIQVASSAVPGDDGSGSGTPEETPTPGNPFDFFHFDLPDSQQGRLGPSGLIQLVVIQTDTAINSGNSGGALLDSDGRLIGINVAIATGGAGAKGNIGVGFAIPSHIAQRIASELIEHGEATHGLLGVSVANVTDDPAQVDATVIGASVVEVVPGGAGDAGGLRVGDIIIGLDGVPITNKTDATAQVRTHAAGSTVEVSYVRGDQVRSTEVTLGDLGDALG